MSKKESLQIERAWALITGLLLGAGVFGHALRWVILEPGAPTARYVVAGSAMVLYGLASLLTWYKSKAGPWIAILGPLCGMTAVTLSPKAQIDMFQFVLGIPQFMALFLSAWLLYRLHKQAG